MATATTIAQQLGTVRATLQQIATDYPTVQFTQPERARFHDDLVALRGLLNGLQNITSGAGK